MKTLLKNTSLLLALLALLLTDSCKCDKPEEYHQICPTCEIQGQYCENYECKCPDGQEVVGSQCYFIDRSDTNQFFWTAVLQNGNCFDSILCNWYVDFDDTVDTSGVSLGGNASIGFAYMGIDTSIELDNFGNDNVANVWIDSTGYRIKSSWVGNMPCIGGGGGVSTEGYTNAALDTLWCHFVITEFGKPWVNHGEFDQIFVRY